MLAGLSNIIGQAYGTREHAGQQAFGGRQGNRDGKRKPLEAGVDRVELSPQAPRPLPASLLATAREAAEGLTASASAAAKEEPRLRMDRVLTAVATLSAMNLDTRGGKVYWPGGLPAPTGEELAAAYRRVCQRLADLPSGEGGEIETFRRSLVDRFRNADFHGLAQSLMDI